MRRIVAALAACALLGVACAAQPAAAAGADGVSLTTDRTRVAGELGRAFRFRTTVANAEMIKYASNAFLALKISYINEIANVCDAVGAFIGPLVAGTLAQAFGWRVPFFVFSATAGQFADKYDKARLIRYVKIAEIAVMALDAGLLPYGREIIAIGGTGAGADTALVETVAHTRSENDLTATGGAFTDQALGGSVDFGMVRVSAVQRRLKQNQAKQTNTLLGAWIP